MHSTLKHPHQTNLPSSLKSLSCTALLALFSLCSGHALAVNKCEVDGKVIYSDTPCKDGKATLLASVPVADPDALKKANQETARAKAQLKSIEAEKKRSEAREEKEQKVAARKASQDKKKEAKCKKLALHKEWAEQDVKTAQGKQLATARKKLERTTQSMTLECGPA